MLRWLLCLFLIGSLYNGFTQVTANDSVTLGAGLTDMVFYDLNTGTKTVTSNTDWHLAVTVRPTQFPNAPLGGTTIRINEANGVKVYYVPNADAASFSTVDTTGYHTWGQLHDSDTLMDEGALNTNRNTGNAFDFGWGLYNSASHNVVGDSLYLIELPDGSVKKFIVESLVYDTAFNLKYCNVDNSNMQMVSIRKKDYLGKNFVYLNLSTNQLIDKEPLSAAWQLWFTRYAAKDVIPGSVYPTVGVLGNTGTVVAARYNVPTASNDVSGLGTSNNFNAVGWNWKAYDSQSSTYNILDSLSYFIQSPDGAFYKLVFTDYGGSTTGVVSFYKEGLATGINNVAANSVGAVYPVPCVNNLYVSFNNEGEKTVDVIGLNGNLLTTETTSANPAAIPTAQLPAGLYLLRVTDRNGISTRRFVVGR